MRLRVLSRAPGGAAAVTGAGVKPGVKAGWVLVELQDGDELASQPGHIVERAHNLQELAGVASWRDIVTGNGESPANTNAWVLRAVADGGAGGEKNALGTPVFTSRSRIYLPPTVPRKRVAGAAPTKKRTNWFAVAAGVVGAAALVAAVVAASNTKDGV